MLRSKSAAQPEFGTITRTVKRLGAYKFTLTHIPGCYKELGNTIMGVPHTRVAVEVQTKDSEGQVFLKPVRSLSAEPGRYVGSFGDRELEELLVTILEALP